MELTSQQSEATEKLRDFFGGSERCFILKGYAGTGKTFLLGCLARELAAKNRDVWLIAPTGRAARVLARKTGRDASTVHRAIYNLKELVEHDDASAAFKFYFRLRDVATDNLDVVVFVDEASMVSDHYSEGEFIRFGSGRLLADLLSFLRLNDPTQKSKLVMVGDPAQLPPVTSPLNSPALDAAYLSEMHELEAKEYELTEVVRQTAGSPILREATAIRETLASGFHNRLSIRPDPPSIEAVAEPDLPRRFVDANRGTRLPRAICVAYSNATCLNLNIAIRAVMLSSIVRDRRRTKVRHLTPFNGKVSSSHWREYSGTFRPREKGGGHVEDVFVHARLSAGFRVGCRVCGMAARRADEESQRSWWDAVSATTVNDELTSETE